LALACEEGCENLVVSMRMMVRDLERGRWRGLVLELGPLSLAFAGAPEGLVALLIVEVMVRRRSRSRIKTCPRRFAGTARGRRTGTYVGHIRREKQVS